MTKSNVKFHSHGGKRIILIVDDEMINREILRHTLEEEYDILLAENGEEAFEIVKEKGDNLNLILLDLIMPGIDGKTFLRNIKADNEYLHIPIIVMTADDKAEVECLELGAADFIPKPYPPKDVIMARVKRTIELSEDRDIIHDTERDALTGLYNREYFYRYAEKYDHYHKDIETDAIVLNINHFHILNERFGKAYGDEVLCKIGQNIRDSVAEEGGIVSRRDADNFLVYCPHREIYADILNQATRDLVSKDGSLKIRLRMGVYSNADKSIDIERRFDRAKLAADTIRNNFNKSIAIYDSKLHDKEMYAEQLIDDFQKAIQDEQFEVYYQPKFNIQKDQPVLTSAEALVRWFHPDLGVISPGIFVPLFEENGLVRQLDGFVWNKVVGQINRWKNDLGIAVPVSVNVSRVDMFEADLVENFKILLDKHKLTPEEFLLEITESAYTEDSDRIIDVVKQLRSIGFKIEMDDFGTGYSSLSMISSLPIDALKIDMGFIRKAFENGKDTRMIEIIIDIADYLNVPVIAEGVENKEQMETLKNMGCDIVQGYYFSKPVPADEFAKFLVEKKNQA